MINVNFDKAKEIHKNHLRTARVEAFKPLDVAFMKAIESGDMSEMQTISEKKQQLRDVTIIPEEVQTVDELKSYWPGILGSEPPYFT